MLLKGLKDHIFHFVEVRPLISGRCATQQISLLPLFHVNARIYKTLFVLGHYVYVLA